MVGGGIYFPMRGANEGNHGLCGYWEPGNG